MTFQGPNVPARVQVSSRLMQRQFTMFNLNCSAGQAPRTRRALHHRTGVPSARRLARLFPRYANNGADYVIHDDVVLLDIVAETIGSSHNLALSG